MAPGGNTTYILLSTWQRSFKRNAEGDSPAFGRRSNLNYLVVHRNRDSPRRAPRAIAESARSLTSWQRRGGQESFRSALAGNLSVENRNDSSPRRSPKAAAQLADRSGPEEPEGDDHDAFSRAEKRRDSISRRNAHHSAQSSTGRDRGSIGGFWTLVR